MCMIMSFARHSPNSNYQSHASDRVAIGTTFYVFSYNVDVIAEDKCKATSKVKYGGIATSWICYIELTILSYIYLYPYSCLSYRQTLHTFTHAYKQKNIAKIKSEKVQ